MTEPTGARMLCSMNVDEAAWAALDSLPEAVLAISPEGRVVRANAAAEDLRRRGVVPARLPGRGPIPSRAPARTSRHGRRYLWVFRPLPGTAPAGEVEALVFVTEHRQAPPPRVDWLRVRFGLSEAEAALTVALVDGSSLKEAAARRGVRESTVRSQLRSVFRKTNTRRQSELVAKVLRGVPRLRDP